jgi:hypothetical protein
MRTPPPALVIAVGGVVAFQSICDLALSGVRRRSAPGFAEGIYGAEHLVDFRSDGISSRRHGVQPDFRRGRAGAAHAQILVDHTAIDLKTGVTRYFPG